LRLGEAVGGRVDRSLASPVAWAPVSLVPHRDGSVGHFPHIIDRTKPGIIGVLADGCRFVNEADGYYDYVAAMVRAVPEGQEVASWLICAHAAQRRYSLGFAKPAPVPLAPYIHSGYLKSGRTIEELARVCGIDPTGLTDAHTRVLKADGDPVPGLYAAGADMSSVMGGYYPSGGNNIGPAMTFGYVAGRHIAGATAYENADVA
jgi:succinate dehydrogenase/fumarate reductase flavoprotein subunit